MKKFIENKNYTCVAVSKTKPNEKIKELYDVGFRHFGENKVQEMVIKNKNLPNDIFWHMIGHLQSNKVKMIVPFVHLIHSVDSIKILSKIIQNKIDLGIELDSLTLEEFEKETKHMNFIFASGIDLIYEFFNFDKNNKNQNLNKILRYLGKDKTFNNTLIKMADRGLNI